VASFGEQELIVNARICGNLRVLSLSALPALYPRLGLMIGCTLIEHDEPLHDLGGPLKNLELIGMSGELRVKEHGAVVGVLFWVGQNQRCRSSRYPSEDQLQLASDLDPWRLEQVEKERNGASPVFWLQLWPMILMEGRRVHATSQPIRVEVPRDRWLEFLEGSRYGSFDVLEVRIPLERKGWSLRSLEHIRAARRQFNEGHFDDAVGFCRKAIEAMLGDAGLSPKAEDLAKALTPMVSEKRAEAYATILSKIKHVAAMAQHDLGAPAPLVRAESLFILRVTENLCSLVGELQAQGSTTS